MASLLRRSPTQLLKRALARPPSVLVWKVWEKLRRRSDRNLGWQTPARSGRRWSRARLEGDLGSRFFQSSAELDATAAILSRRDPAWLPRLEADAVAVLERRFVILGAGPRDLGRDIAWSRDYRSDLEWKEGRYCFDYDLLDFERPTDVRVVWEMSRFHELVRLGQAYRATRRSEYFHGFRELVTSWLARNPVARSVNWSCAMEVAIRAVNLLWAVALFLPCDELDDEFLNVVLSSVAVHGRFVRRNVEWNDLRNNHYLSDLVGLLLIGAFLPELPESRRWIRFAVAGLDRDARLQIHPDGVDYEGSIPYQQLVVEIYLAAAAILRTREGRFSSETEARIERMLEFVAAYTKPNGRAPVIGDGDDGRLVVLGSQPRGDHRHLLSSGAVFFHRPDLAAGAGAVAEETLWLFGPRATAPMEAPRGRAAGSSAGFPEGGFFVMREGDTHAVIDAGDVGMRGRGAHGHNDVLSFELVIEGDELIIDSGCSSYTADRNERSRVLSVIAHNAPNVDGEDVSALDTWGFVKAGPVPVRVLNWTTGEDADELLAEHLGYSTGGRDIAVRRRFRLEKRHHRFLIDDEITGTGDHVVAVPFHLHPSCRARVEGSAVLLQSGSSRYRLTGPSAGAWTVSRATAYLEYARPRGIDRAEYRIEGKLPMKLQFVIGREPR